MAFFLTAYMNHCTWVTSEAYSSPSIVLSARSHDGSRIIFDDFREAYYWLRHNTPEVCLIFLFKYVLEYIAFNELFFFCYQSIMFLKKLSINIITINNYMPF